MILLVAFVKIVRRRPLTAEKSGGNNGGNSLPAETSCPQMPLTDLQIRNAKPKKAREASGTGDGKQPACKKSYRLWDGEFVSPCNRKNDRCISDNAVNMALRRMGIPQDEMCGHGFRATARTVLAQELQIRTDLIEHQLGHQVIDPNGRAYNRTTFLPERRLMMEAWADYLEKLKSGEALRANVKKRLTDIRAIQVTTFA